MNVEQVIAAIDELLPEDLARVKKHVAQLPQKPRPSTVEEWQAEFKSMAKDIRGDSSDEEMQELIDAINLKSKPSEKGL